MTKLRGANPESSNDQILLHEKIGKADEQAHSLPRCSRRSGLGSKNDSDYFFAAGDFFLRLSASYSL